MDVFLGFFLVFIKIIQWKTLGRNFLLFRILLSQVFLQIVDAKVSKNLQLLLTATSQNLSTTAILFKTS